MSGGSGPRPGSPLGGLAPESFVDRLRRRARTPPDWRTIALVVAFAVAVAALGAAAWLWTATAQDRGLQAYAAALAAAEAGEPGQGRPDATAAAIRELEAALASYPSSPAAARAAYELGNLRYAQREWDRARAAYQIVIAKASAGTLRQLARVGIASAWEAERNFPKALEVLQAALADAKPMDFLYEQLLLDLARIQERAGRPTEAVETYRRLLKGVPKTARADDVRTRLARLGATP